MSRSSQFPPMRAGRLQKICPLSGCWRNQTGAPGVTVELCEHPFAAIVPEAAGRLGSSLMIWTTHCQRGNSQWRAGDPPSPRVKHSGLSGVQAAHLKIAPLMYLHRPCRVPPA